MRYVAAQVVEFSYFRTFFNESYIYRNFRLGVVAIFRCFNKICVEAESTCYLLCREVFFIRVVRSLNLLVGLSVIGIVD